MAVAGHKAFVLHDFWNAGEPALIAIFDFSVQTKFFENVQLFRGLIMLRNLPGANVFDSAVFYPAVKGGAANLLHRVE